MIYIYPYEIREERQGTGNGRYLCKMIRAERFCDNTIPERRQGDTKRVSRRKRYEGWT